MVQLSDIRQIENGARFLNVDLHIHSFGGSQDVKDSMMTPTAIVDSAVRQGLSVIAITDHNSYVNVRPAIDHARNHYPGRILVLAGTEVTTAHGHLLVYFDPDLISDLQKFLSRLDLIGEMGADNTRTAKSMADTIAEAHALDGICIAAHIDRSKTGFDGFAPGFQNWKKDIIDSPGLYGLECDSADALRWYSEADDNSHAGAQRKRMLEGRRSVPALSARHHLAHVQGSDAHSMASFERQDPSKPWSRIKLAELRFGAFRTALVDPTARVRASASVPRSTPRICGMAITGGFLNGQTIHFSSNLNCLIGGRGTGKSTMTRALAYGLGLDDDFSDYDNCPDVVTIFCEDEHGVLYRYVRTRIGDIEVKAKDDQSIVDVPIDSFRIEYFRQGELAKVAEDPLKNPTLLQAFLDRHTNLHDLIESETSIATALRENASRLVQLETAFAALGDQRKSLGEIETKLKIAEVGNLREVVSTQSKLTSEKAVREAVERIAHEYTKGWTLSSILRDFSQILVTSGALTNDEGSLKAIGAIRSALLESNDNVQRIEGELCRSLGATAAVLRKLAGELKASHQRMSAEAAINLANLKAKGVATDIAGLERLLRDKTSVVRNITAVEQRKEELQQCRQHREILLIKLADVRAAMIGQRKGQLAGINGCLSSVIKDYTIFVKYDDSGITLEFESFMQEKMSGTYLQVSVIRTFCCHLTPGELADFTRRRDYEAIVKSTGISREWAEKIVGKLCYWDIIFALQILAKPPKPVITVHTKAMPRKSIPVLQLSDGQRHTILLTIAMLADSNIPLIIDQPEDDLDNAFIASTIVGTLREIKEKRQVIIVTHNANIAVLGDSELILPMQRENDCGATKDRGSIDAEATKSKVMEILEGGPDAFLRRREMYNWTAPRG